MALFIPPFRQLSEPDIPAMVRVVSRGEVEWNRPLFKAPPLKVKIPASDQEPFFAPSPKIERLSR